MRCSALVVSALAIVLSAAPLEAQVGPRIHNGFWIGFGGGIGWNSDNASVGPTGTGGAGYLRMGATLSERFLIGGETLAWGHPENGNTYFRGNLTADILWYASRGLFLKAGLGYANVATKSGSNTVDNQGGFGSTIGLGYDILAGKKVFITVNTDWMSQVFESGSNSTTSNNLFLFTVGLTWH